MENRCNEGMKSRDEIIALVRAKIRLKHFSLSTEDAYCGWTARYHDFCTQHAGGLSEEKIESFLSYLALQRRVAARTQNQAFAAIMFLYKEVLGKPLGDINSLRAKRPSYERTCPSREQIRVFRGAVEDTPTTPARLLVDLMYGCGMRVSEPLELRVKDVLWGEGSHGQLLLKGAKGGKDRRVPIPKSCVAPLRLQLERARVVWDWDRANAKDLGVSLPFSLAHKYPRAPFLWQWFWVFPAQYPCSDPWSGIRVRYHILQDCIQRSVQRAAAKVQLDGLITPHVLRHAYATHSRESLDSLRQLLGHSSLETTAGYRHPDIERASNPLDDLVPQPSDSPG
jgi:integrase